MDLQVAMHRLFRRSLLKSNFCKNKISQAAVKHNPALKSFLLHYACTKTFGGIGSGGMQL